MKMVEIIDEIIGEVDPDLIPLEFIMHARVMDKRGRETLLDGKDLEAFMSKPVNTSIDDVSAASIILDVRKMRKQAFVEINAFFEHLSTKFKADPTYGEPDYG